MLLDEVALHLRKLKNNKAAGIDGIPAEFYKYASEKLEVLFCSVFNYILDSGEYPLQWSEGLITALHKKGDPSDPDNYRKIIHFPSHVSCFTKDTLTRLVKEAGISEKVQTEFIPIQRYGFFNCIDWARHNQKDKILSDDYIPRENPSWIERQWLETKKQNFTTDSIAMILKKSKQ